MAKVEHRAAPRRTVSLDFAPALSRTRERIPTAVIDSVFSAGNLSMSSVGRAAPEPRVM